MDATLCLPLRPVKAVADVIGRCPDYDEVEELLLSDELELLLLLLCPELELLLLCPDEDELDEELDELFTELLLDDDDVIDELLLDEFDDVDDEEDEDSSIIERAKTTTRVATSPSAAKTRTASLEADTGNPSSGL